MRRSLTLGLDQFGSAALAGTAERLHLSPEELWARAAHYYLEDICGGRLAHRFPRFRREQEADRTFSLALDLDEGDWRRLERESERQGVSVQELLEHAALYLLAELDSGRASSRLLLGD
jgi:hypothetical protein